MNAGCEVRRSREGFFLLPKEGDKFIKERKGRDIDLKAYAKYILREGTKEEKRDILLSLKTEIFIKSKEIVIK